MRKFNVKPIVILALVFLLFSTSCVTRKKTVLYQQVLTENTYTTPPAPEYAIQTGDMLYIKVQSMDAKAAAFFNGPIELTSTNSFTNPESYFYFNGYEVNKEGYIHLPYLDSLKVATLNTAEIEKVLTDSLRPVIKDVLITVRLASFRVSVLGEVTAPGTFVFYKKRPTIFDAIALARPTEYYNATGIVVTRTGADNKINIVRLDITSEKILSSPYYYLQPNDQIYIEPLKVKKYGFSTFPYAILLSTISTVMLIYSLFK